MGKTSKRLRETDIYDTRGRRKYLTGKERTRFRKHADTLSSDKYAFCLMLYYTGCRISEALEIPLERIDHDAGVVVIRTLKQRRDNVHRVVPLPTDYLRQLRLLTDGMKPSDKVWTFSRKTGYRAVKAIMAKACIEGIQACPKGLRHGFGVACVEEKIPLSQIASWMGHSRTETTAIYLNVTGEEERKLARRTW